MKKMLMAVALFATMMFTGCSTDYKSRAVGIVEDYTSAIEKAESEDDLDAAQKEYKRAQEDLEEEMEKSMTKSELETYREEASDDKDFKRELEDAMDEMHKALKNKREELRDKE